MSNFTTLSRDTIPARPHEHGWMPLRRGYPVSICRCGAVKAPGGLVAGEHTTTIGATGVTFPDGTVQGTRAAAITVALSDNLMQSADSSRSASSTTAVKLKEIKVKTGGNYRIKFTARLGSGTDCYARIYRNGAAVGTQWWFSYTSDMVFSEDISGWAANDLCQLYAWVNGASLIYVSNFRVYGDGKVVTPAPEVMLD